MGLAGSAVRLAIRGWRGIIRSSIEGTASDHVLKGQWGNIMPTKDEEANELARKHYQVETGLTQVFRIAGSAEVEVRLNETIMLLEVNENTVASGIMPIQFGPSPASGVNYSSIIVEVTPEEYEKIRNHQLKLPPGWSIGESIPRPAVEEDR